MEIEQRTRSWHCIMKNPNDYGYTGDVKKIMISICNKWDNPDKKHSCAITYCRMPDNTYQYRMVFQSSKLMRISALKKRYPLLFETVDPGSRHTSINFLLAKFEKGEVRYVAKGWLPLSGTWYDNHLLNDYEWAN